MATVAPVFCSAWSGKGANPTYFIDDKGEYGMTQFSFGVIDTPENLREIKKMFDNPKFKKISEALNMTSTQGSPVVPLTMFETFKKDFYKQFI